VVQASLRVRHREANQQSSPRLLWVVIATFLVALLAYSQAVAYFGNESFHLLAAQLINTGKKPYLDFFYQHPPLFIYLNAAWMRVFGESWRSAHALSALLAGGCIAVTAVYVYNRLGSTRWRLAISAMTAALLGLNFYLIAFGTVALPFGLCLLLTVVSFRLTVDAVHRPGALLPILAGLACGASAASSLLTAPVVLVLAVWLAKYDQTGQRLKKCLSLIAGAAIPFVPLMWLGLLAPRQAFFDVVEYHLFHRVGSEGNMIRWNLREILDWFGSLQGFLLTALSVIGLGFTIKRSEPEHNSRKPEFYLCAWLTIVLSVYLAVPRPTFSFYYVLVTPFVGILAAMGLNAIGTMGWFSKRRFQVMTALAIVYLTGLGWQLYKMRREIFQADHKVIEAIARDVDRVTPRDAWLFAFEQVYFEARRTPPPGMENAFDPNSPRDEFLAENRFETVCMMARDSRIQAFNLFDRYAKNKAFVTPNFTVYLFWDRNEQAGTPVR